MYFMHLKTQLLKEVYWLQIANSVQGMRARYKP